MLYYLFKMETWSTKKDGTLEINTLSADKQIQKKKYKEQTVQVIGLNLEDIAENTGKFTSIPHPNAVHPHKDIL